MCKQCQSIGKMAKKKKGARRRNRARVSGLNTKDAGSFATGTLLPAIVGAVAAGFLDKLPFLDKNPQYVNYAGVIIGTGLAIATKSPMAKAAGVGMAVVSGAKVANDLLDGQGGVGLLLPGQSARGVISGPAGDNPTNYVL